VKCTACKFDNRQGAKFCKKCGNNLEVCCSSCGSYCPPDSHFCDECGHRLIKPEKPSSINYAQPQSYTPKHLAEKILITRATIEGERKLVTVLFADVANFTNLSTKLDPEQVHQIMDGCFIILMDEIHKYEGTINQFTGDGVMALFGAPVAHEDHANRACHTALLIQKAMKRYGEKVHNERAVEFKMRIGLNSGPVIVGAIGDNLRMDYTAVGETTNLAARMESLAQPGSVLVSENTHRLVKDYFVFSPPGKFVVKGKEEPQVGYELFGTGAAASRLEAAASRGLTRFVGRQASMTALLETYEKVKSGKGQVVGIVGEAGVGKSRLLFEFRHGLSREQSSYLEGRCIHFGSAVPYLPIIDILKSFFEVREGESEIDFKKRIKEEITRLDEKLQWVLPMIQDLLSLKVEDESYHRLEPKQRRDNIFEALRDLIVLGSQQKPLVLAIEDLHWIDKTSEEFLDYLIGSLANVKVMLILVHRPEYIHRWGSKSYFIWIGLDQLTMESSAQLVRNVLDGVPTAPELNDLILNHAGGNPLFMEELTNCLLQNGTIQIKDNEYILTRLPLDLQVPDTIQGIIAARIDRLEDNLKRIMQAASVIGREFTFKILEAINGIRQDLRSQLLNLQGLELIYEKRLFPEIEYVFKHALIQEVTYNSLLLSRRKEIHQKICSAIESLYAENLEEFYEVLAYHYSRGGENEKACRFLKLSGLKAAKSYSLSEAYAYYKKAFELLSSLSESETNKEELIDLILLMRIPLELLGYPDDDCLKYLYRCEKWAKEGGDAKILGKLYSFFGSYYTYAGDIHMALKYTEAAFEAALKAQDLDSIVTLGYSLNWTYLATGHFSSIIIKSPQIIEIIERNRKNADFFGNASNPYSGLCILYGLALGYTGRFGEGKPYMEKGLRKALALNDDVGIATGNVLYGLFESIKGDWASAKVYYEKGMKITEKTNYQLGLAISLSGIGWCWVFLGDFKKAKSYSDKGLQVGLESGVEWLLSMFHYVAGIVCLELADLESAEKAIDEALRLSIKNGENDFRGLIYLALGIITGMREPRQTEQVEKCFEKGMEILSVLGMKPSCATGHQFLGEYYLDVGCFEAAKQRLMLAEEMFATMGMEYWLQRNRQKQRYFESGKVTDQGVAGPVTG